MTFLITTISASFSFLTAILSYNWDSILPAPKTMAYLLACSIKSLSDPIEDCRTSNNAKKCKTQLKKAVHSRLETACCHIQATRKLLGD
jgi:hypothetical protein